MTPSPHTPSAQKTSLYPRDTVGHVMTNRVPVVTPEKTLAEIYTYLHDNAAKFETINYVYVLSEDRTLIGVLSVKEVFSGKHDQRSGEVCTQLPLYTVHPEAHQEKAAYLALRHGIKAIPVVDHQKKFMGEVTADTTLKVLHKEMHEDTLRRAGIRHPSAVHSSVMSLSIIASLQHRIPWLILGLGGGLLAARVVGLFEEVLAKNIILAAFIPLIVYMSDAVGTQMEAYIIRDLAIEKDFSFSKYLVRHSMIVAVIAVLLSVLLFIAYGIFSSQWHVALVLGVSLFGAVMSSVFTGLLVPYFFSRASLDPADASGPIATIIQDILSIVIYFGIATSLL